MLKTIITLSGICGAVALAYFIGKDHGWSEGWMEHKEATENTVTDDDLAKTCVPENEPNKPDEKETQE